MSGWSVGRGPQSGYLPLDTGGTGGSGGTGGTGPDPSKWSLAWDEQFSGSSLDSAKWTATDNSSSNNNAYWRSANVAVSGGSMQIKSYNTPFGGKSYQSGNIQTYAPFKWCTASQYFRAEQRSRNPVYKGFWPAPLWFRRIDLTSHNADDGEFDLYEGYGGQYPNFRSELTLHDAYANNRKSTKSKTFASLPNTDPYAFHTWTMEKTPGRIDTWLDGIPHSTWLASELSWWNTICETPNKGWAARATMQIEMLNSSGAYAGFTGQPDGTTDWSQPNSTLEVDYMTFWNYIG